MAGLKRPESVLVVVATRAGEVLLLERCQPRGFWQSVTGSLEGGETPRQAAQRELWEETGLQGDIEDCRQQNVYPILPAWRHRYAPEVTHNREHVFRLLLDERPAELFLSPREHCRGRWLPRTEALEQASSATDRAAIRRFAPSGSSLVSEDIPPADTRL